MKLSHMLEAALAGAAGAAIRTVPWQLSLKIGERLGDATRILGVRRAVAEANLAIAFPERTPAQRAEILVEHYRELGRVVCEYPRLPELVGAPERTVVAEVRGMEHLLAAREAGRGAILVTGHYSNFELLGAYLGRLHPVDFVVKPLSNPAVEARLAALRGAAGVGTIGVGAGVKRVFAALKANRWTAMLADQDARRHGLFVPFFGRPSSTPAGPAEISLRTGAPIIMGFGTRGADGRHALEITPPLVADREAEDPVLDLTARHTARLEEWVRKHPAMWFWLHRRWKSAPVESGR